MGTPGNGLYGTPHSSSPRRRRNIIVQVFDFAFAFGQAVSRTTYASLFALVGTAYGTGDGLTTFNLPDVRGRVTAAADNMGGTAAGRLTSIASTLGSNGGEQSHTLATGELPAHQHAVFLKDPGHAHTLHSSPTTNGSGILLPPTNLTPGTGTSFGPTDTATTGITIGSVNGTANDNQTANAGGSAAHNNIQPTIVCNYILRIF
jgi:microcystin-dependent protein